jgi:hypothetical protein
MLRRVALVRSNVSEERSASFIRMTRIGELGTTLAVTSNRSTLRRNTKTPILHSHRREYLISYIYHCCIERLFEEGHTNVAFVSYSWYFL